MIKQLSILIAEDEQPARAKLLRQLSSVSNVEVIAAAEDGEQAVELALHHNPDVVLLDIQMPKLNGFEVLQKIQNNSQIIFTTAYDSYAVKAFDAAAVDYLLKPFSTERLELAIDRAQGRLTPATNIDSKLNVLIAKIGNANRVIPASDVALINAEDGLTMITGDNFSLPIDYSLDDISELLPSNFVRVHRRCIVNVEYITEFKKLNNSKHSLTLRNLSNCIKTSRAGTQRLKQVLNL